MLKNIKYLIFIIKNYKYYKYWKSKSKGIKHYDFNRGPGYYIDLSTQFINLFDPVIRPSPVGTIWETEMKSGRIGLYELVTYTTFSDPRDMVKAAYYDFIGRKNEKVIKDCTFEEFMELYNNLKIA